MTVNEAIHTIELANNIIKDAHIFNEDNWTKESVADMKKYFGCNDDEAYKMISFILNHYKD